MAWHGVYPRVCGGTTTVSASTRMAWGLSPRVRGNLVGRHVAVFLGGSIPACAGEPRWWRPLRARPWVYPRVCGGTQVAQALDVRHQGLSPRVRGNLDDAGDYHRLTGSIPACAGEPDALPEQSLALGVYPRVCGGTSDWVERTDWTPGLSPRVRGNRSARRAARAWAGSIPACAGEPGRHRAAQPGSGVYPRVCGGTVGRLDVGDRRQGLSPRVRGNRLAMVRTRLSMGSIPACAGEPARLARRA